MVITGSNSIQQVDSHIMYVDISSTESSVVLKNLSVSNIKFEGASFLYVNGIGESGSVILEECMFKDMDGKDGTGIRGTIIGGYLEIKKTYFSNINGRAIYFTEGISGKIYFIETTFDNCKCDENEGCGIYLFINDNSLEDYKFNNLIFSYSPQFTGSIIYINYPSLFESASSDSYESKFEGWNSDNYLLNTTNGISYNRKVDVLHSYPIIFFFSEYSANTIYITKTSLLLPSFDGRWCGRDTFPCASILFGKTHLVSAPTGSASNSLKIIANTDILFTGSVSILLEDVTVTSSSNSVIAVITIISLATNPSIPVISYKSSLNIQNIEFKLNINNNNKFNSLIGSNNNINI
jgi:hypothetical protein